MSDPIPDTPTRARRGPRAVVVTALFLSLAALGGWYASRQSPARSVAKAASEPRSAAAGAHLFDQVMAAVAQKYVDSIAVGALYQKAVTGIVEELGDPYSSFLTPERMKAFDEQLTGTSASIGLPLNKRDGYLTAIEPLPDSPSEKAGVQAGDRIVSIDGASTYGMVPEDGTRLLRGTAGTKVALTIERAGALKKLQLSIPRDSVHRRMIPRAIMIASGVGYVAIQVFGDNVADELARVIDSLVTQGAKSLIIDVRGNPGGLLEQGVAVSELFLNPGQEIVQLRSRPGEAPQNYGDREPQKWPSLALSVLVDRSSASAAEIVAGALQDHDRAIIVGSASYGKGNAQTLFTLPNGAGIRLTTSRWFTPAGRSINRQPLTDVNGDGRVTAADTVRPVFKTDEGRRVLGGGGIAPDVVAEDSAPSIDVQTLTHAMGAKLPELRNAIADEAQRIKRSGKLTGPMAPISRDMLNDLYANLEQRKIAPARSVFDAAGEWLARALGYEATRARFGADAEFTRRSHDDVALQRAIALVQGARSPREVFAHLDTRKGTAVPASK